MNAERLYYLKKFEKLIVYIKAHKNFHETLKKKNNSVESFTLLSDELNELKSKVFPLRFAEAKRLFNQNKHSLKISAFELMEYDFHENTHTKVLRYLFDFRLSGKMATRILKLFLEKINTETSKLIAPLVKWMEIFLITRTQLTNYKRYLKQEFPNYQHLFILLSYKQQQLSDEDYIVCDYALLISVLEKIKANDNILNEYKLLLKAILSNTLDKLYVTELAYQTFSKNRSKKVSLFDLETIKKSFNE